MRAVVQVVHHASIRRKAAPGTADPCNSIGEGLLIFLGVHRDDQDTDVEWMAKKILGLRLFDGEDGTGWKRSVKEANFEILCISQYTLYGNTNKGSKLDFHECMAGPESMPVYEKFLSRLGALHQPSKIQKGFFGRPTLITSEMNGPVTITLDSPAKASKTEKSAKSDMSSNSNSDKTHNTS